MTGAPARRVRVVAILTMRMFLIFWVLHLVVLGVGGAIGVVAGADDAETLLLGLPLGMAFLDLVFFSPSIAAFMWLARSRIDHPWQLRAGVAVLYVLWAVVGARSFDVGVVSQLGDPVWLSFLVAGLLSFEYLRRRVTGTLTRTERTV